MTNARRANPTKAIAARLLLVLGWMAFCPELLAAAQTRSAIVTWERNNSHTNLAAYIIKYGTTSGLHTGRVDIATNFTTATVANLVVGRTYFFVVIARNV